MLVLFMNKYTINYNSLIDYAYFTTKNVAIKIIIDPNNKVFAITIIASFV